MKKQDTLENQANYAYLALGSNLGSKINNLEYAKYKLSKIGVKIIKSSSYYHTKSWPNKNFPDFINSVLLIKTDLILKDLFNQIKFIEESLGRKKAPKNYPRICDIDIIDYSQKNILFTNIDLKIPHPRMQDRSFVLFPLFEIDKNWKHPKNNKKITQLLNNLPIKSLRSIKIL